MQIDKETNKVLNKWWDSEWEISAEEFLELNTGRFNRGKFQENPNK